MMRNLLKMALMALLLLAGHAPALAADKPLVMESGSIKQLPSATTLQLQATTTGAASINLPHGTGPSSPTNGDCWTTTAVFACRINGATASFVGTNTGDQFTSIANGSLIGNNSGSTGAATALTGTQATALLDNFTSSLKGLAPASGGGTTNFLRADGSWAAPAGGGGGSGACALITETVTSSSATNVSFTSISSTYRDLIVKVRGRGTKAAANVDIRLRFNADTGGNYDGNTVQGNSASTADFSTIAATSAYVGNLPAASATTGIASSIEIHVADYRGTTFRKSLNYVAGLNNSAGVPNGPNMFTEMGSMFWRSTSAITQVDLFPSTAAFVDGTVASLYACM